MCSSSNTDFPLAPYPGWYLQWLNSFLENNNHLLSIEQSLFVLEQLESLSLICAIYVNVLKWQPKKAKVLRFISEYICSMFKFWSFYQYKFPFILIN